MSLTDTRLKKIGRYFPYLRILWYCQKKRTIRFDKIRISEIMIEEDYYEEDYASDYDWREEEWDALTDGQYGDYPGGDIDYDVFGFGG